MADYNNSTANWTFSPVYPQDNNGAIVPKNGTPIAIYNYLFEGYEVGLTGLYISSVT